MSLDQVFNTTTLDNLLTAAQENPFVTIGLCAVAATAVTATAVSYCFSAKAKRTTSERMRDLTIGGKTSQLGSTTDASINTDLAAAAADAVKKKKKQ